MDGGLFPTGRQKVEHKAKHHQQAYLPIAGQPLRQQFGIKDMAGYVVREGGKMYVMNYEGTRFEVPQPVANNTNMAHYGLNNCLNDYGTCLAYMQWK